MPKWSTSSARRSRSSSALNPLPWLALCCLGCSGSSIPSGGPSAPAAPLGKPEHVLTAEELVSAYDRNAIAADEKYRGKVLEVTGQVKSVRPEAVSFQVGVYSYRGNPRNMTEQEKRWMADRPANLVARIDPTHRAAFARAGNRLTVVGRCVGSEPADGPLFKVLVTLDQCRPKDD